MTTGPAFHFPTSTLVYFQFVFAAITPILMLGAVLGRINFKAWLLFVPLWTTCIYTVNAFLIWGGGFWAQKGAVDYSGGYVIHLAAGVSGFVAAAVIGPRLARDREIDAPNNLLMVACGAGLLWLGWNGFNGGDPYYAGADAAAAVLNTNLATAVAFLVWVAWDYATGRKPSLIGSVNGMIVGLVAITPAAGFVNGWGAMAIGAIGASVVYVAYNYLSRVWPFRIVDDTLGVIYTHGIAGLVGGLLVGLLADSNMIVYLGLGNTPNFAAAGSLHLLKIQFYAGLWVILFSAAGTFILLKLVGLLIPLRMSEKDMEMGDLAVHGHEVYPSDVPSLGYTGSVPSLRRRHRNRRAAERHLVVAVVSAPRRRPPRVPEPGGIMATKIIVSYDGTENDTDALALGQLLARAGGSLALAYVRHAADPDAGREQLAQKEAEELLENGARWLGDPDVPRFVVLSPSTPEGLRDLAEREQADVIAFGSEYRTSPGHVAAGTSAQRLLEGGPIAVAIAPGRTARPRRPGHRGRLRGQRGGRPRPGGDGRVDRRRVRRHGGDTRRR